MSIGLFDSGIGGISVVKILKKYFPYENIIYIADTKNFPYGKKKKKHLIYLTEKIIKFFIYNKINNIIVACNTISSVVLPNICNKNYMSISGVLLPTVKYIFDNIKNGRIGIIATEATVNSNYYEKMIIKNGINSKIISVPCPELANLIESGDINSSYLKKMLKNYLTPIISNNCNYLILGCTHYSFIKSSIIEILRNKNITIIDPAYPTINDFKKIYHKNDNIKNIKSICYVTGDKEKFYRTLNNIGLNNIFDEILYYKI